MTKLLDERGSPCMRVLMVTQAYYPFLDRGGPAVKVRAIAKELAKRGHHVTVLTADLGFRTGGRQSVIVERDPRGWRVREDGVEAIYLRGRPWYRTLTVNPGVISFCNQRIETFDLVHIFGLYDLLGPIVAWFCRRRGVPYLVEPMGMIRPIDRGFRLKRLWHAILGNYLLRAASLLIATSEQEQEELIKDGFPQEKVRVRHNGLALEEFRQLPPCGTFRRKLSIPSTELIILFLGRLIPRKGADILIEAFSRAFPESGRLVIAGPEGERGYLHFLGDKSRNLGTNKRVIFTGPLYGEEKKAALSDADVFVLPSRYENFGNAAAEAVACGTPVIVTDSCGISLLVKCRAGLVIPYDAPALSEALKELTTNKALYTRLQAGCKQVASQISWDELSTQMETYYTQVLKNESQVVLR